MTPEPNTTETTDVDRARSIVEKMGLGGDDTPVAPATGDTQLQAALAGREGPGDDVTETPKEESEGQPEPKGKGKKTEEPKGDGDAEKARRYLRLKGFSETVLELVPEEELAAMRASFLEADRQRTRTLEELDALRAETERQKTETAKDAEPNRMVPAAAEDLEAQLQKLVDDGDISEGVAKTLADAMSAQAQALLDQVQAKLAPIEQQTANAQAAGKAEVERLKETVRAELGERYPGIVEPDTWAAIEEDLRLLSGKPKYDEMYRKEGVEPTLRAMLEAAVRMEGLEEVDADEERAAKKQRREARDAGQPSTAQRDGKAAKAQDTDPISIARRAVKKAMSVPGAQW